MNCLYDKLTVNEKREVDRAVREQIYTDFDLDVFDVSDDVVSSYRENFTDNLYGAIVRGRIKEVVLDIPLVYDVQPTQKKFVSSMEIFIKNILTNDLNVDYEFDKQFYRFDRVKNYKFDFYLKDFDCIVEYDGEQHFHDVAEFRYRFNHDFKHGIHNDNIKNEFCLEQNIPLMRIPYELYPKCTKQTRRQLIYLLRYFMQMKLVIPEIVEYYAANSESNYAELVLEQNQRQKDKRKGLLI